MKSVEFLSEVAYRTIQSAFTDPETVRVFGSGCPWSDVRADIKLAIRHRVWRHMGVPTTQNLVLFPDESFWRHPLVESLIETVVSIHKEPS